MKSVRSVFFTGSLVVLLLTACGGGDSGLPDSANNAGSLQTAVEEIQISGAGIKGPLAFADTKIFSFDPSFPDFYDSNSPVATAMTDQYAKISGLSVPGNIQPPYILVIGGEHTIDLNTGKPPVISRLVTVITEEMLASNKPVYATPLTTLAVHMASQDNNASRDVDSFTQRLNSSAIEVSNLFSINPNRVIDVFGSPLVINDATVTLAEQEEAVQHRATLEAFAAKAHSLALSNNLSTDTIIERIALDIESDGVIDNAASGTVIGGIDPEILMQDPAKLLIPNTTYQVEDVIMLMEEERVAMGTDNGPELLVDTVDFDVPVTGNTSPDSTFPDSEPAPAPEAIITLSVNSIDFGNVDVGGVSNVSTVTLTNSGNAPLTITSVTVSEGFIKSDDCNNYLPAGNSCRVEMQFVPTVSGVTRGSLIVSGDAKDAPFSINLTGTSTDNSQSGPLPKIVDSNAPGVYFHHDFDNESLHTYTADDLRTTWNNASGSPQTNAVKIVSDPDPSGTHGNVMQVFYAASKYLHGDDSGSRWQMDIGSHDELYFAYDVYFEEDAEFVRGGKLPGLSSVGVYSNAGTASDGTDRWTGVLMWHEEGSILNYVYHANQPGKFGDNIDWDDGPNGQVNFQRGKWHRVEMHYKMNTPGILDGSLQAWLDGVKVLDTNKIMYRMPGGEDLKIGTLQFLTFYGGSDSSWAPSEDQHTYFDNFVVSTQPITH